MPQYQIPMFPGGSTIINKELAIDKRDGEITYYSYMSPIFKHAENDSKSFRMFTSQLICLGRARPCEIIKVFGVHISCVMRDATLYRKEGPAGFFKTIHRNSRPSVMTEEVKIKAQELLADGNDPQEVAQILNIKYETLKKAIYRGNIVYEKKNPELPPNPAQTRQDPLESPENLPQSNSPVLSDKNHHNIKDIITPIGMGVADTINRTMANLGKEGPVKSLNSFVLSNKSQRNIKDNTASMGMGATNTIGRTIASLGKGGPVKPHFEPSADVVNAGVMLAIPALLSCGLLNHVEKYFKLPLGYYDLSSLFLSLSFSALARFDSLEQFRFEPPGEWGKLLGLDRCPEVKTLRKKIKILSKDNQGKKWGAELAKDWLQALPSGITALYVDGHVRVYSGHQANVPKHFVPRIKLCLRAACDYWVNTMDGQPLLMFDQPVDQGLIKALETDIIPWLEEHVPNQPSKEQLDNDPELCRFVVVFDREGYSPDFIDYLWEKRIACKTYAKNPGLEWPEEEFKDVEVTLVGGEKTTLKLAERKKHLQLNKRKTDNKQTIIVREIRKLNDDKSQTTIYTTEYKPPIGAASVGMFARWTQENFLKYVRRHYGIDSLISHSAADISDDVLVYNPEYRAISSKIRSLTGRIGRLTAKYGKMSLTEPIEPKKVEKHLKKKAEIMGEMERLHKEKAPLEEQRRKMNKRIPAKSLSEKDRLQHLSSPSKHLVDTIKIICYRAETAMYQILKEKKEKMSRGDDEGRTLLRAIYQNEADLEPDEKQKTLTIKLHHMANHASSEAIRYLCQELNATETIFPGTDLRLVYEII